jgi:hypothetical protein
MTDDHQYPGLELKLFTMAYNWKAYIKREIGQYIKGHILEVGAGIGETTKALTCYSSCGYKAIKSTVFRLRRLSGIFG